MNEPAARIKACIHCQRPTAGMCPRCREYSCIRQVCLDSHDARCPQVVVKVWVTGSKNGIVQRSKDAISLPDKRYINATEIAAMSGFKLTGKNVIYVCPTESCCGGSFPFKDRLHTFTKKDTLDTAGLRG